MFAKTFRNTLIASTLVIAGAALATPANAQLSDNVPLEGSVTSTTAISVTLTGAETLDLGGVGTAAPDRIVNVATLNLVSNNVGGVTVTATADGVGELTSLDSSDVVAYQVKIADTEGGTPVIGDFGGLTDDVPVARGAGGLVDGLAERDLFIMYDAPSMLGAGTYTSDIAVTIADL